MIVVTISGSAAELKKLGSDARIVYLDGKTHLNTYNDGLTEQIRNRSSFRWKKGRYRVCDIAFSVERIKDGNRFAKRLFVHAC